MTGIIGIIITVGFCIVAAVFFKKEKKKNKTLEIDKAMEMQKTANEFINVKDVIENKMYTLDGLVFVFVKIEGICLELYNQQELKSLNKTCSTRLAKIKFPFKYIAVSRPVDVSKALTEYYEQYSVAEGGRRAILKSDMEELTNMVMSGETLERQHYIAIWGKPGEIDEEDLVKEAVELEKIFEESGIKAETVNKKGIVKLCNLVNNPAYVHIESDKDIYKTITLLKD